MQKKNGRNSQKEAWQTL